MMDNQDFCVSVYSKALQSESEVAANPRQVTNQRAEHQVLFDSSTQAGFAHPLERINFGRLTFVNGAASTTWNILDSVQDLMKACLKARSNAGVKYVK